MNKPRVPSRQAIIYLLLVVAAAILLAATIINSYNSFRSLPLYLFLLFAGIGLMLAFGTLRGGFAGLVIISLWIVVKRSTGVWEDASLFPIILELAVVLGVFIICGYYTDRLRSFLDAYFDSVARLELLNLEDKQVGLIKATVGKLRLQEEEERSVRYRRPFSLLLVDVNSLNETDQHPLQFFTLMRVVANTIKSTTRSTDIPFLAASNQVAIILPETDIKGASRVVTNIMQRMLEASFLDENSKKVDLKELVSLRYGFAAFTGFSHTSINMFAAAIHSLQKAQAQDRNEEFQIQSVEWEMLGTAADSINP